jgi:hypothetical protein
LPVTHCETIPNPTLEFATRFSEAELMGQKSMMTSRNNHMDVRTYSEARRLRRDNTVMAGALGPSGSIASDSLAKITEEFRPWKRFH